MGDLVAARRFLHDLLGYLDWCEGLIPARNPKERNVRAMTWKALQALDDPEVLAFDAWIAEQRVDGQQNTGASDDI